MRRTSRHCGGRAKPLLGKIGLGEVVEAGKEEKVEDGEVDVTALCKCRTEGRESLVAEDRALHPRSRGRAKKITAF